LLARHFQNDHRVCTGPFGSCAAVASAAHAGFIVWSIVCVIGDLLLTTSWLALGTKVDPRPSNEEMARVSADEWPQRRDPDLAFFYPTMSEDLLTSYNGKDEDFRR